MHCTTTTTVPLDDRASDSGHDGERNKFLRRFDKREIAEQLADLAEEREEVANEVAAFFEDCEYYDQVEEIGVLDGMEMGLLS